MNIILTFTLDETNALLTALGQLPYTQAVQLIQAIHNQAIPQIQAANAESVEVVEPEVVNG
jgi:hypothetical protein